ncbi:hypothetical protein CUMW_015470 [Citrus unshiu]|nr:hypothetical protein CUMW_015470 [Citrus unshiu]
MEDERRSCISRNKGKNNNNFSHLGVELKSFTSCLKWVCVDQSNIWRAACDNQHQRPYDAIVQVSLSVFAIISFLSLSSWSRKYGLNRFLFLDKLSDESEKVCQEYAAQLRRSMKLLCIFVLPCFGFECAYKIWWYITGASEIPYFYNTHASNIIACILQLCSWLYRISIYILACILYQLVCYLHLVKMEDFAQFFQKEAEVVSILQEHLRIRRNLRIISHRYRAFILLSLILVTASQFISLLTITRSSAHNNIFEAGELAVFPVTDDWESDEEVDGDDLDNTKINPIYAQTVSYQKRQALVTYLENNRAGITVFGFMMDRTWLHAIFGIELGLLLWLLNKTIGSRVKVPHLQQKLLDTMAEVSNNAKSKK